jgi:hypothetical protein
MSGARVAVCAVFALTALPVLTSAQARVTGADLVGRVIVARTSVLPVGKATLSTVVGQEQIESLPIDGRNFMSFTVITPGRSPSVMPSCRPVSRAPLPSSPR